MYVSDDGIPYPVHLVGEKLAEIVHQWTAIGVAKVELFATVEYVARHSPGSGMITGDIGKSLGDGVALRAAVRAAWKLVLSLARREFGGSDARVDNFV